jgi:RNA polymerase sigma factor (sigma-70 family)
MKYAHSAQKRYGDLFSDEELGVVMYLVHSYWRSNNCLRWVYEREELVQDCLIHWLDNRESYHAEMEVMRKTYMNVVVENYLRGRIRKRKAQKRRPGWEAILFSTPVADEEGTDLCLGDTLGGNQDLEEDLATEERAAAIKNAMAELTNRQRRIAKAKVDGTSMTAVAEELGITRDTVHRDLKRICKVFEDKNLKKFLS